MKLEMIELDRLDLNCAEYNLIMYEGFSVSGMVTDAAARLLLLIDGICLRDPISTCRLRIWNY